MSDIPMETARLIQRAQTRQTEARATLADACRVYFDALTRALATGSAEHQVVARGRGVRVLMCYMACVVREDSGFSPSSGSMPDERLYELEGYALKGGDLAAFPYPTVPGKHYRMTMRGLKLYDAAGSLVGEAK